MLHGIGSSAPKAAGCLCIAIDRSACSPDELTAGAAHAYVSVAGWEALPHTAFIACERLLKRGEARRRSVPAPLRAGVGHNRANVDYTDGDASGRRRVLANACGSGGRGKEKPGSDLQLRGHQQQQLDGAGAAPFGGWSGTRGLSASAAGDCEAGALETKQQAHLVLHELASRAVAAARAGQTRRDYVSHGARGHPARDGPDPSQPRTSAQHPRSRTRARPCVRPRSAGSRAIDSSPAASSAGGGSAAGSRSRFRTVCGIRAARRAVADVRAAVPTERRLRAARQQCQSPWDLVECTVSAEIRSAPLSPQLATRVGTCTEQRSQQVLRGCARLSAAAVVRVQTPR